MSSDLWVGAVTTLAGAVAGGAISFILSRQQIKAAHAEENLRRSADRRFEAYADFLTKARSFRNAIRRYGNNFDPAYTPAVVDELGHVAHTASALVFLVVESTKTYDVTRAIVTAISDAQKLLPGFGPDATDDPWFDQNEKMAKLLREFQVAAREELEIGGVDRSHMLNRTPRKYL